MPTQIPQQIGGADPLYIAELEITFEKLDREAKPVLIGSLAVCQYVGEEGFYLFTCDKDFNTYSDYFYDELSEALEDAERIYQQPIKWKAVRVN